MTTVDVWVREVDGPLTFEVHNGLFGLATSVMHELYDCFKRGEVSGEHDGVSFSITCTGSLLLAVIGSPSDGSLSSNHKPLKTTKILQQIRPEALFEVGGVEF